MNNPQNKTVKFIDLGVIDYKESWDFQTQLFEGVVDTKVRNRRAGPESQEATANYLLFCEHPHVYTLGKSGSPENLLIDEEGLKARQASFYRINRGGDITYHGPGQIVVYPILDLDNFFTDIHQYLRRLEEAVIRTLADYGLDAGRIDKLTGVWLDYKDQQNPRKICALGVKSSRWVTMHGLAFNINADLSYFEHIVPCGIEDKAVTSLAGELGAQQNMNEVKNRLKDHIAQLFEMELTA